MTSNVYVPPPVMVKPPFEIAKHAQGSSTTDVVFDIETTGLNYMKDELLSIAAVTREGEKLVEEFIIPVRKRISKRITELTGLEIQTVDGTDCMFLDNQPVIAVTLEKAMENFIMKLKEHAKGGKINLMAHNCFGLDVLILCKALSSCNKLTDFADIVVSVTDTDELFNKEFPELKKLHSKLEEVARHLGILPEEFVSHNALSDAEILAEILDTIKNENSIASCTYTWSCIPPRVEYLDKRNVLYETLHPLLKKQVISRKMGKIIAGSGIAYKHLQEAFLHSRNDGLTMLLSANTEKNKPRVTKDVNVIANISKYFASRNQTSENDEKDPANAHPPETDKDVVMTNSSLVLKKGEAQKKQPSQPRSISDKVHELQTQLKEAEERIEQLEHEVRAHLDDLTQHQFINTMRFFGIPEGDNELTEDVLIHVLRNDMKLTCSADDIDWCNRAGRFQTGRARPILVQFSSYRMKRQVFYKKFNLRGTNITVCEELTEDRLKLYHAVRAKVGVRNTWTNDGFIYARDPAGNVCPIRDFNDLSLV